MSEYINNCFCCGHYLVPRYKRLVNNIFPQNPEHGLDKNNLERLRFYALVKPEKLDKSVRYMSQRIARYLDHRNRPYVILGIKAMDDTMKSCYQQLNTFVDDYLETLRLVLNEGNDLELIEHVVASFESFCEIREEAPNYQRNYQFFVSRFTQLCYNNDEANRKKFRCLGLRGHHALFRKTANDELQNDAWKHMDQIVPSIIFNMDKGGQLRSQQSTSTTVSPENIVIINETTINEDPSSLADTILRDLFGRAQSNNNISTCIQPILADLDKYGKWIPCDFSKYIFSQIMNSIKHHNSYVVIDLLLNHLDKHLDIEERTNIKTSVMNVIHDCLIFAAPNTGVGSTMLHGITRLLEFLERSFQIERQRFRISSNDQNEQQFQTAVINGIKDFAEKLPDFQMMEIIKCIAASLPTFHHDAEENAKESSDASLKFQLVLLKTIQKITLKKHSRQSTLTNSPKVTTTYESDKSNEVTSTLTTFPHQLFDPLIKMMSTTESEVRLIVLEILQVLVDRRHYADRLCKIRILKDISQLDLPIETKKNRLFDIAFMKKVYNYMSVFVLLI
ncbi:unnamed protein product [Rotaria sp. Silwood2]|nr:unnamed protein product [Rotaria sp. Silwood2]